MQNNLTINSEGLGYSEHVAILEAPCVVDEISSMSDHARLAAVGWIVRLLDEMRYEMENKGVVAADGSVVSYELAADYAMNRIFSTMN